MEYWKELQAAREKARINAVSVAITEAETSQLWLQKGCE